MSDQHIRTYKALRYASAAFDLARLTQAMLPTEQEIHAIARIVNDRPESDPDRALCESWSARVVANGPAAVELGERLERLGEDA